MKRLIGVMLVVMLGVGLTGCNDDFLTTVPPGSISEATFWKTEKDATYALTAIYNTNLGGNIVWMDAGSDNAFAQRTFDAWNAVGNGGYDANNGVVNDRWQQAYQAIARTNIFMENIDNVQMDETRKNRYKGEALFFRAYHYNNLVAFYGDVPLVLKSITIEEGRQLTRAPKSAVLDQIYKDLDFAAANLPTTYGGSDKGRVTKGAALALKARVALWQNDWAKAAEAARAVKALGIYSLYPDYKNLFRAAGEGSAEVIFDDQRLKNNRAQGEFNTVGPRSLEGTSNVVPLASIIDEYELKDGTRVVRNPGDLANPTGNPGDPHTYENRDPRFYASVFYPGGSMADYGKANPYESRPGYANVTDPVQRDFNTTQTGWNIMKYVDPADKDDRGNSGLNFILIRYADVLLMLAESANELDGPTQEVYDAVNAVRARASMPDLPQGLSKTEMRDRIRHERRVELAFEGLRMFDIRRWGIAKEAMNGNVYGMTYVATDGKTVRVFAEKRDFIEPRHWLFPVPNRELDLNKGLGQNTGW